MSKTEWTFYVVEASDDPTPPGPGPGPEPDPTPTPTPTPVDPTPVVPKTNDDFSPWLFVIFGASLAGLIVIILVERALNKKNKK